MLRGEQSLENILGIINKRSSTRPCKYDISYKVLKFILEEEFVYIKETQTLMENDIIFQKLREFRSLNCVLQADGSGDEDKYEFVSVKRYNNFIPIEITIYTYMVSDLRRIIKAETYRLSENQALALYKKYDAMISEMKETGCGVHDAYWHTESIICH